MALFVLGSLCMTQGVSIKIKEDSQFADFVQQSLSRYVIGDWGKMAASDKEQNDEALKNGDNRIFASYLHPEHPDWKIWIITEADRSVTTILFPSEY